MVHREFVYFFHAPAWRATKIGFSASPHQRLGIIQTSCPFALECDQIWECGRKYERVLHSALSGARLQGEWFDSTAVDDLLFTLAWYEFHHDVEPHQALDIYLAETRS